MSTLSVSSLHITLSTAGKIIHTRAERQFSQDGDGKYTTCA